MLQHKEMKKKLITLVLELIQMLVVVPVKVKLNLLKLRNKIISMIWPMVLVLLKLNQFFSILKVMPIEIIKELHPITILFLVLKLKMLVVLYIKTTRLKELSDKQQVMILYWVLHQKERALMFYLQILPRKQLDKQQVTILYWVLNLNMHLVMFNLQIKQRKLLEKQQVIT